MQEFRWTQFKQLHRVVERYLLKHKGSFANFEMILQNYKPDFVNSLKNSVRRQFCSALLPLGKKLIIQLNVMNLFSSQKI